MSPCAFEQCTLHANSVSCCHRNPTHVLHALLHVCLLCCVTCDDVFSSLLKGRGKEEGEVVGGGGGRRRREKEEVVGGGGRWWWASGHVVILTHTCTCTLHVLMHSK